MTPSQSTSFKQAHYSTQHLPPPSTATMWPPSHCYTPPSILRTSPPSSSPLHNFILLLHGWGGGGGGWRLCIARNTGIGCFFAEALHFKISLLRSRLFQHCCDFAHCVTKCLRVRCAKTRKHLHLPSSVKKTLRSWV